MARKTVEERREYCDVGNKEEGFRDVGALVKVIGVDGVILVGRHVDFSLVGVSVVALREVGVCVVGIGVVGELVEAT